MSFDKHNNSHPFVVLFCRRLVLVVGIIVIIIFFYCSSIIIINNGLLASPIRSSPLTTTTVVVQAFSVISAASSSATFRSSSNSNKKLLENDGDRSSSSLLNTYCPIRRTQKRSTLTSTLIIMSSTSSSSSNNEMNNNNNNNNNMNNQNKNDTEDEEDPYLWLEDIESEASLNFAKACNEACLQALGNPELDENHTQTYQRILAVLESNDRIPHVTQFGVGFVGGAGVGSDAKQQQQPILFNFWKDAQNPKGLWRKTTLESYMNNQTTVQWETVLDVDALAKQDNISWVWKGSRTLPRARDPMYSAQHVTRALVLLSRGGSDAVHIREFDLTTNEFVAAAADTTTTPTITTQEEDNYDAFDLPEAKTRASYASRNVLYVGTDFGPGSLTDSGYPRTVRRWVRGTPLKEAPIIFEGESTDVSVSAYISDERIWGGGIYEIHSRALTFYTSKYWIRKVQFEHLLAPNDPARDNDVPDPPEFVPVDIPQDAELSLLGNMMIITLRSDWEPVEGATFFAKGSVIYVDTDTFLEKGKAACEYKVLFAPTERTAFEYYTCTKNYLIVSTMDNVKSKLEFYKISDRDFTKVSEGEPQIRDCSVRPVDPYSGSDEFWFSISDFVTPSTLYLADASKVTEISNSEDAFITKKVKALPPQYDSSNLIVEQRFAFSKDGTKIPYFIVMKKDMVLNGSNPTLLYGYGGFEVSLGPHYVPTAGLAWLERGGVYVEANIRGGGEFGPAWHQAALKENRNKCYEDFIAVAEHLISSNICKPKTLAIRGGSNGGLLMGNMYVMRPDLFGAIHCAVPLLDMKRYHTLLAGASWMAEYGNPDTEDWEFLQKYSPYHNIDKNANYPPILVTTSTRDDRVHPGHARKFVQKLFDMGQGKWPVYYYENIEGGHGGAADAKQSSFMTTLAYDWMFETLTKNAANKELAN